jgi:hypothetical protein
LLDGDETESALAALAAAIFCANLVNGLAGLLVSLEVIADGTADEATAGALVSGACFDAAARRRCSASIASFDLGFAASPEDEPGLAAVEEEGPGDGCPPNFAGL